jgi:hypothetical protein
MSQPYCVLFEVCWSIPSLEKCSDWLTDNKLSLHLGKTECMLFGPKRKIRQITNVYVKCNEHVITSTEVVKYLGVNIQYPHWSIIRDRPFNLQGAGGYRFLLRSEKKFRTTRELEY